MLKRLKTKQFWKVVLRDGLLLIIILYSVHLYQTRNIPEIAPALNAQLISGKSIELSIMVKQSPVLIYFWGSWCPICSVTSPVVTELSKEYQVLTIALSSGDKGQILSYLQENNYRFPVINDPDGFISRQWGVFSTPAMVIINRQGEISSVTTGVSSTWGLKLRLWLAS